jgi:transcriptional regulator with XRE-family HTH domain
LAVDDLRREALALLVASALDDAMARAAISQAQLALRARVGRATIGRGLKGTHVMDFDTLTRCAEALDCDVVVQLRPRPTVINSCALEVR